MIQVLSIIGIVLIVNGGSGKMEPLFPIYALVCLVILFFRVKNSESRWRAFGYAIGTIALIVGLGVLSTIILVPHYEAATNAVEALSHVTDQNEVLDKIGRVITVSAPLAATWATCLVPLRKK